eukprot:SAG11_NODE_1859_length_4157_cov_6.963282_3_plen_96_part_00
MGCANHHARRICTKPGEVWTHFDPQVPEEELADFEKQMKAFFSQPKTVKQQVRRTAKNSKGWYDDELTKQRVDWKEGFDVGAQNGSLDLAGLDGI